MSAGTDEPTKDEESSGDSSFDALWSRVLEAWDDDKTHAAALEYALRTEKLAILAGHYRRIKDTDPARAERATKKIDGIVAAATQMLMAQKTPARTKIPTSWTVSFGVIVAIVLFWVAYQVFRGGR